MRLDDAYAACRRVNARTGRTFYLATLLLPPAKRRYVHALYAFARCADELVDAAGVADRAARLDAWSRTRGGDSPVGVAFRDTVARWGIAEADVDAFLASMAMDLTVTSYATYDDLLSYVHGSAAVVGRWTVPVLGPLDEGAYAYAEDLGVGFQLANFVRDVGEDLRRGRVYLPGEDLAAFGLTRRDLATGVVDGRVRRLLAFEVARAREVLRSAEPGIRLLHPTSRDCVRTALVLYGGILDAVERADYRVLDRRVSVGIGRRAVVAGGGLVRAGFARRAAARQPL
ncbi:MAG TPA: phytoene/squalene synthase family protein [Frankiaceae bacterium]|jgi:phytoene synthase|nr:phytoene/squalene synthase family protein [Frankiaceae bacterium]